LIAKFATIYITTGFDPAKPKSAELRKQLGEALEADPRVRKLTLPPHWDAGYSSFFPRVEEESEDLMDPVDDMQWTASFRQPFCFEVSVPAKNQPLVARDDKTIPERYLARWDGSGLMVFWEQPAGRDVPWAAGQVVRDVVKEAVERAGYVPKIQGPSLAHVDLRLTPVADDQPLSFRRAGLYLVEATVPLPWEPDLIADFMYSILSGVTAEFYGLENHEERIVMVNAALQAALSELLRLQYLRANLKIWPPLNYMKSRRQLFGWRTESRALMARIWLCISNLQSLREAWMELLRTYRLLTEETASVEIFELDRANSEHFVRGVDSTTAQSVVQDIGGRLDNRDLVLATAGAALVGAVVGVILSHH
jgi:hypothetical protein